jgi:phosphinothricin acetyltransferase
MIRPVEIADAEQITDIYNYYIENTVVTFEEEPITPMEMRKRIEACTADYPWLVYAEAGKAVGYCYATKWRARSAYRHSVETTVYVEKDHCGRGIGTALTAKLIDELRESGVHVLVAGITLPNEKSQKLHEKMGFRQVARFEEIGKKFNRWLDVGYWEYKYE